MTYWQAWCKLQVRLLDCGKTQTRDRRRTDATRLRFSPDDASPRQDVRVSSPPSRGYSSSKKRTASVSNLPDNTTTTSSNTSPPTLRPKRAAAATYHSGAWSPTSVRSCPCFVPILIARVGRGTLAVVRTPHVAVLARALCQEFEPFRPAHIELPEET